MINAAGISTINTIPTNTTTTFGMTTGGGAGTFGMKTGIAGGKWTGGRVICGSLRAGMSGGK